MKLRHREVKQVAQDAQEETELAVTHVSSPRALTLTLHTVSSWAFYPEKEMVTLQCLLPSPLLILVTKNLGKSCPAVDSTTLPEGGVGPG